MELLLAVGRNIGLSFRGYALLAICLGAPACNTPGGGATAGSRQRRGMQFASARHATATCCWLRP
jgi:hypothetical protein